MMIKKIFIFFLSFFYLIISSSSVFAISSADLQKIYTGTVHYLPNCSISSSANSKPPTPSLVSGSNVYILGDSITVMSTPNYHDLFSAKGINVNIDASSGRGILKTGMDNNRLNAMDAITLDKDNITNADAIVVALGTNGDDTTQNIDGLVKALQADNSKAPIYWVDTIVVNQPGQQVVQTIQTANQNIYSQSVQDNYSIISWFKLVDPNGNPTTLSGNETDTNNYMRPLSDPNSYGFHPSSAGSQALASLVVSTVSQGGTSNPSSTQSNASCCNTLSSSSGSGSGAPSSAATGPFTYTSNAQEPYYMEQYIIDLLKDIAQAEGVPPSVTVTQDHVVAMVAWQIKEGGNTHNTGNAFNLWNMGYLSSFSQLFTHGTSDGSQTGFASYDAGVEGNTIEMTGSNQSRIGKVLSTPGSTADQVLQAIAFPDLYPGNLAWAWGGQSTEAGAAAYGHSDYYPALLTLLSIVRSNYGKYASTEIGSVQNKGYTPGAPGVPISSLKFSGGSGSGDATAALASSSGEKCAGSTTNNGSTSCTASTNADILCEAKKYIGIYYGAGLSHNYTAFRNACPEASISGAVASSTSSKPGPCSTDCSGLVSVSVSAAFKQKLSYSVGKNGLMSNTADWKPISESQVQAGDIATHSGQAHVVIVDHYDSKTNTLYVVASSSTGSPTAAQTFNSSSGYDFTQFFRYIGPGSSGA